MYASHIIRASLGLVLGRTIRLGTSRSRQQRSNTHQGQKDLWEQLAAYFTWITHGYMAWGSRAEHRPASKLQKRHCRITGFSGKA